jgi:2-dehydro-3-deoxyphosphogluconate aldolase/(4S)-4-hydroxy-2-oxoglutarate aldolase
MQDVPLVAVGGVKQENLQQFLSAGAVAVGVGNSLFGSEALNSKDADMVAQHISGYLRALN